MSKFGTNIKSLRKNLEISQFDFASKLGVNYSTISTWETGKSEPSINMLIKISKTFDISYEDLLL